MKTAVLLLSLVSIVFQTGCAARNKDVIIDPTGVDMGQYQSDFVLCQDIARQVNQKTGASALGGAVVGGLIGATLGNSDTAKKGAGVGAITGTARGARATKRERKKVIKNCLRNKGYVVLN